MMPDEDLLGYIPTDELSDDFEDNTTTYSIDFEKGRIGGNINELEAIKQCIVKALITPRFSCPIYSDNYGSEIHEELRDSPSDEYSTTVIPDLIKETLLVDDRITDVGDFVIENKDNHFNVSFVAKTIYGDIAVEEVI